ncbi:MAG: hypothetical protein IK076_05105 [Bacteroidales bacterium]|nr:hypothetical protein [Bacteroidales bacterium]
MALSNRKLIMALGCIALQGMFFCGPLNAQGGTWGIKAGADRMTIGSFRDSYTSLGFTAGTVELDYATGPSGKNGSFAEGYNYPVFGLGISWNGLSEVKFRSKNGHYSDMLAAYGTVSRDLLRTRYIGFGYDVMLGLSYSKGCYDVMTNSANWFFSSPVLFFAGGGGHLTWMAGRRLDLVADISVKHNSSARFAYPNGGLNYWGGGISARYRLRDSRAPSGNIFKTPKISGDLYQRGWSFEFYGGGGVHVCAAEWKALTMTLSREELSQVRLKKWPMASLSADAIRRVSGRFGLGVTVDGFWNSNTERLRWADGIIYDEDEIATSNGYAPFSAGVGIVQEVFYRNLALYVQEGLYLYRHMGVHGGHGPLYERAGFRYYFQGNLFAGVCIKAHTFKADYLDFTIGWVIV